MTSDLVSSVDIVTGSSKIITAKRDNEYSDYLWLARGGGSGVQHFPGIVIGVEFSGLPKNDIGKEQEKRYTHFRVDWAPTAKNAEAMPAVMAEISARPTSREGSHVRQSFIGSVARW